MIDIIGKIYNHRMDTNIMVKILTVNIKKQTVRIRHALGGQVIEIPLTILEQQYERRTP